jgi:hypothetical protein
MSAEGEDEPMPPCMQDEVTETEDDDSDGNDGAEDENEASFLPTAAERSKEATRRNKARRDDEGDVATSKWCTQCFEDKELDEFFNGSNSNGNIFNRVADCKECRSEL